MAWPDATLALAAAGGLAIALFGLWLLSLRLKDSSIVDIFWGFGFVLVAGLGYALGHGEPTRKLLVTVLTAVWGLRLTGYLAWRNHGRGEDPRYTAMRDGHGARWGLVSLPLVFGLQGLLIFWVSLPLQVAASAPGAPGVCDLLGTLLVLAGVACEATGDFQLARFKADPAHKGLVMDRGLWRYTRHPNYFGDFCVWWGLYLVACGATGGWWTIGSPLVMSFLLLRVSGVTLLESHLGQRPGYAEYVQRTSPFFPWPPRSS